MTDGARQRMIDGTVTLLAQRGLDGTSFSEVIERTGAPRGSIYHHFPDGKDQLVAAAVDLAGSRALTALEQWNGSTPAEITAGFVGLWRRLLTVSNLSAGCSVLAVTVATSSPDLLDRSAAAFRSWRLRISELFVEGGVSADAAARFAATLVSATEGAVVLSRAERSMEPFELVAAQLAEDALRL